MKQCARCNHWHHDNSAVCEACWVEMGQMAFDFDEDDEYMPTMDSVFDGMAERENRLP